MDCLGLNRAQMLYCYEDMMDSVANSKKKNIAGQLQLFDMLGGGEEHEALVDVPKLAELPQNELMQMAKEL